MQDKKYYKQSPQETNHRKESLQTMEQYLPSDLLVEYKQAFQMLDRKNVGRISLRDLSTVACSIGFQLTERELCDVTKHVIDMPQSALTRCLDFSQFLAAMAAIITDCISDDEIKRIFREFDKDGDGYITSQELRALLLRLGDDVTEKEIQEMMREADIDGDGRVSLSEFIQVMTCAPPSTNHKQTDDDVIIEVSTNTFSSVPCSQSDDVTYHQFDDVSMLQTHDVIMPPRSPGAVSLPTPSELSSNGGEFDSKVPPTKRKSSVLGWLRKSYKNSKLEPKRRSCDDSVISVSCHSVYSGVAQKPQKRRWKSLGIIPGFNFRSPST